MRKESRHIYYLIFGILCLLVIPEFALAADQGPLPDLSINIGGSQLATDGSVSSLMKMMILISAISFAPAVILTMTSFTRISVVLGMTRTALGTQSMPPNTVITGLALFLTFAIMNPVVTSSYEKGIKPFVEGQMAQEEALKEASVPIKKFLITHSREKDLALFLEVTKSEFPEEPEDVPFYVAVPAFVLSELNTAFQIGFLIALPFLILDMVVSSILTSMSMITLPPVVISLPLKLMLFVVVDGWHLIIGSLVKTYHT
ncbi:MAG: flagellar type III secretion system pore protein FliP [Bdellovibrionales bacterium]|nr:flagellar type III secretion system pore protein FliP [Bdellovibrionales bacterium]